VKLQESAFRGIRNSSQGTTALVTGVTGQDGIHLVRHLARKGIKVVGLSRAFQGYLDSDGVRVPVVALDYSDPKALTRLLDYLNPEIIFHLASNASSTDKETNGGEHWLINVDVVCNIIDWMRRRPDGSTRLVQALSSELFRGSATSPQTEATYSSPINPYGEAKARAREILAEARSEGIHASGAILYNHESILRPPTFLSRRVTSGAARIALGLSDFLELRNFTDQRDWGHSADYTQALLLMGLHETPSEYVVSSGELRTVKRLCEVSFGYLGLDIEKIRIETTNKDEFQASKLLGVPTKAEHNLGWIRNYSFEQMVEEMTEFDLRLLESSLRSFGGGSK
jgi:GDPmannose 4,6-dehydratase